MSLERNELRQTENPRRTKKKLGVAGVAATMVFLAGASEADAAVSSPWIGKQCTVSVLQQPELVGGNKISSAVKQTCKDGPVSPDTDIVKNSVTGWLQYYGGWGRNRWQTKDSATRTKEGAGTTTVYLLAKCNPSKNLREFRTLAVGSALREDKAVGAGTASSGIVKLPCKF